MDTPQDPHTETVPVTWNDKQLLDAAGGNPASVKALLSSERQPLPTDMAIYMWYSRGAISNVWRPRLAYALLRTGRVGVSEMFKVAETRH